jgi:adenylate cyclase
VLKDFRAMLGVWLAVVAAVLGLRSSGLLQPAELAVYDDLLSRIERPAAVSDRIALIEISENDIQELGHWPLSDLQIAILIESILGAGASAVGVDIYRDLAIPPGEQRLDRLLEADSRIVLVFKHGDSSSGGVAGRAVLEGTAQLGFSDMLLDPDGRVRRGLLFLDREDGGTDYAFPMQLATQALARDGIYPQSDPVREEWLRLGETSIPYVEAGDGGYGDIDDGGYQVIQDFWQSRGGFESISFRTALNGELPPGSLAGKIVLVGANADSLNDFVLVPAGIAEGDGIGVGVTGVWLHAVLLDQLLRFGHGESRPLQFVSNLAELLTVVVAGLLGCMLAATATRVGRFTSSSTIVLAVGMAAGCGLLGVLGYAALSAGIWVPAVAPGIAWLGTCVAYTAWISSRERAQRAELMQIFSQVQSPRVANELWSRRAEYLVDGHLEPEAATVTVLFLDMKGYTASAERMQPGQLMNWINDFMAPMARLIEEHGGYPDDYFGDGINADFGVPVLCETEDEIAATARDAVRCALAMIDELVEINAGYAADGLPTVALRIGIHTGPVVVGLLGSRNKGKYTVVGDAVVTAQRLESTDKVAHDFDEQPCRVLLSEATYSLLAGHNDVGSYQPMGLISLKGKAALIGVYRMNTGEVASAPTTERTGKSVEESI